VEPATVTQSLRARALVVWMLAFTGAGTLARLPALGRLPAPCSAPARQDGLLVCDGRGGPARTRAWLAGQKLDVNEATQSDLEAIAGVGPSLAAAIVGARSERGRFTSLSDLDDVRGVGEKTLAKLSRVLAVR
jgi:competence ComEA-like helix-hairpin-helix protein